MKAILLKQFPGRKQQGYDHYWLVSVVRLIILT